MAKLEGVKIIDAKGGVIEKISYDGAEYTAEKVPLREFKTGDIMATEDGGFYTLKQLRQTSGSVFIDLGEGVKVTGRINLDAIKTRFRKVVEFNVGDIVAVTGTDYSNNKPGEIGKIVDTCWNNYALGISGKPLLANWSLKQNIRHATPAEIAEYEKAVAPRDEINVGDYVKNIGDRDLDLTIGKVYEVLYVDGDGNYHVIDDVGDDNCIASHNCEKAERPYEVGDIVRVVIPNYAHNEGDIFSIMSVCDGYVLNETGADINTYKIELVAPVSARKDRK